MTKIPSANVNYGSEQGLYECLFVPEETFIGTVTVFIFIKKVCQNAKNTLWI